MANEFKIKHGFISTGNGIVEGELRITGASYADNGSRIATRPWVTQYLSDNSYATAGDITTAISNLVDSAPGTLDTLNELAAAIGDDPNFATSISTSIAAKLPLTGGTMTGNITFTDDAEGIVWSRNTDGASIKFYNTADGDTDSRLEFHTNDNDNEYFRWTHGPSGGALYEVMKLMPTGSGSSRLTVQGDIYSGSNKMATETHVSSNYLSKFHDMTITLTGDASGTGTFNNMGDVSFAVTVANDSHTHDGRYYTETEVDTFLGDKAAKVHTHDAADIVSGTFPSERLSGVYTIDVSGTSTYANNLYRDDNRTIAPSEDTNGTLSFGFTSFQNDNSSPYADYLHLRSYTDASGGRDNLLMFSKSDMEIRLWQQDFNSANNYADFRDVAFKDELQVPAIKSNGSTPSLNTGISAGEIRTLIGAGTSSFDGAYSSLSGLPTLGTAAASAATDFVAVSGDTMTGLLTASGGISGLTLTNGISGTNFNITGVNQLEIADPGEGIVFKSGSSGDITLAIVDDASDNILNLAGTGASLAVNSLKVATENWVTSQSYLTTTGKAADSDKLDGLDSASFVRSDASDDLSGHYKFAYNSGIIDSAQPGYTQSNIEIYTTDNNSPAIGFHRGGYSATALYEYDGQLYVNPWVTRAQEGLLLSSGNISAYADAAGSAAAVNLRIDEEVLPAIPTNNNELTNGAGYITDGNTGWNNTYGFITASDSITGNAATATSATTAQSANTINVLDSSTNASFNVALTPTAGNPSLILRDSADEFTFNPSTNRLEVPHIEATTITASFQGDLQGNADTATKLATARNIALSGDVTGSANFDGSSNITITAAVANDSHTHDGRYYTESESDARFVNVTGDTITGDLLISGASLGVTSTAEGTEAFYVDGVNGRLFTISDDLSDSLFSVNTISGLPVIEAFADNTVKIGPFSNPVTIDSSGVLSIGGVTAATQTYVDTAVNNLIGGAPGALDTLNELAAAINDNASYASSVTTALGLKAPLASPALTGTPTAPTAATATNTTQIATTAFVKAQGYLTSLGFNYSTGVTANHVVQRDANGYIYANYINLATSETENPTVNSFIVSNGDGWTRKASVAHIKSTLGLGSAAYTASTDYAAASHNHDTLYDAIGSADAVQTFVNEQNFATDAAISTAVSNYLPLSGGTLSGNLTVGAVGKTSDTVVKSLADQSYKAGFEAYGNGQGTGYFYAGQSLDYGGGFSYNGDNSPGFVSGETADNITFFRREAGTSTEVFHYSYANNDVYFNGAVVASGSNSNNWNTAYGWGNHAGLYDASGSAAAVNYRIDEEVLPLIGSITLSNLGAGSAVYANVGDFLADDGKAADSELLDGINSSSFLRKDTDQTISNTGVEISFYSNDDGGVATGDQATLEVYQDTVGADAFMQFHIGSDYAAYFGLAGDWNDFFVGGWSMGNVRYRVWHAGNDGSGSGLDADTVDGLHESTFMRRSANSNLAMNNYNITGVNHITINDSGFGEGIGWQNWLISDCPDDLSNASGNLQISSTAAPEIRVTVDTNGNLYPSRDRLHLLGKDTNRWQIVFCEILDSAGQHEKNLQNPEGEKSVGEYPTGTVLVWKGGKNIPCTEYADHMRMGVAVEGIDSPLIQGAEPVLVTGPVEEGDYLITSRKEGHAEAISPELMRQQGLYDCVFGKALETADGESHLVKVWINI